MPLSAKGAEIKKALTGEYGAERGEQVLYAGKNKGTFTGIDSEKLATKSPQDYRYGTCSVAHPGHGDYWYVSERGYNLAKFKSAKEAENFVDKRAERGGAMKKDADTIPAGLDCAKLDAACSMMDALGKRFDSFIAGRKDAQQEYSHSDLRNMGYRWLNTCKTSAEVRAKAEHGKMTRIQTAFIVEGWVQARKEAGLSENV